MISFYILSKRFCLKREGLSVASITKKGYGFLVSQYLVNNKMLSVEVLGCLEVS